MIPLYVHIAFIRTITQKELRVTCRTCNVQEKETLYSYLYYVYLLQMMMIYMSETVLDHNWERAEIHS